MATSFNLAEFLGQQSAAGSFDSIGQFTIAVDKAAQKLARFTLPRDEAWVQKLIQAAVGWRVRELAIQQTRTTTHFGFQPSLRFGLPSGKDIVDIFLSGEIGGKSSLERFCLALHALGEQSELPFLLIIDQKNQAPVVFHRGSMFSKLSQQKVFKAPYLYTEGVSLTVGHLKEGESRWKELLFSTRLSKRAANLASELTADSWTSPISLTLDKRNLNGPMNLSSFHPKRVLAHPLLVRPLSATPTPRQPLLLPLGFQVGSLGPSGKILPTVEHEEFSVDGIAILLKNLGKRSSDLSSKILWLSDGVVVARETITTSPDLKLVLLAQAADLPHDLTGLSLVRSERRFKRRQALVRIAAEEIAACVPQATNFILGNRKTPDERLINRVQTQLLSLANAMLR